MFAPPFLQQAMFPVLHGQTRKWYAVYTLANHEKRVGQRLHTKGVEVFLPLCTVVKRWKNRTTATLQVPLFTGYAFVHLLPEDRIKVLETDGVLSIVGTREQPTPLPEAEIEALRSGLQERKFEPYPYLKIGNRARIKMGPLSGLEGVIVRKDGRLRIVLSIDTIMQSFAVHVEADELETCS